MSDFKLIFLTFQNLNLKKFHATDFEEEKYNVLIFELKFFGISAFKQTFAIQKTRFGSFHSVKTAYFTFFRAFSKSMILIQHFTTRKKSK